MCIYMAIFKYIITKFLQENKILKTGTFYANQEQFKRYYIVNVTALNTKQIEL